MVRTNTLAQPGMAPACVRVKGTDRALAISVDGNGRFVLSRSVQGAMLAVAEAARNVACAGARPIGATNCLNFGNPERPEIMWQFGEAVERHRRRLPRARDPITGGNVSLYNETEGRAIFPTPVHRRRRPARRREHACSIARFKRRGPAPSSCSGENRGELGGSEYLGRCTASWRACRRARSERGARAAAAARRAGRASG